MKRLVSVLLFLSCFTTTQAEEPNAAPVVFEKIDRTLRSEPKYESRPKYCLLILGAGGTSKVWIVEDGKRLYVDKNANGDLTDDGPPIEPSNPRKLGNFHYDFSYLLDAITGSDGTRCTNFNLRRWNYEGHNDSYGMSLTLEGKLSKGTAVKRYGANANRATLQHSGQLPMYAGWFGTFWSTTPETAPIIHFGGPLTPKLLREREFVIGSKHRRLSLAFITPGSEEGAVSRLSIDALPAHITPRLIIDWPAIDNGPSLQTSHDLIDRCCYWEFYTTEFNVPEGVGVGTAQLTVQFPGFDAPIELTTTQVEAQVVKVASTSPGLKRP